MGKRGGGVGRKQDETERGCAADSQMVNETGIHTIQNRGALHSGRLYMCDRRRCASQKYLNGGKRVEGGRCLHLTSAKEKTFETVTFKSRF